jgi:endonuclease/exonuclease/phosphatase family metal-dependent hydrolase
MVSVRNERKLSLFNRIMLWINYLVIIALLAAIVAKHIPPTFIWPFAFFGLAFPIILLVNILFVIYWLIQFKRQSLFSFIILVFSLPTASNYFRLSETTSENPKKKYRLVSYNSMLFDLYNWKKNNESREKIFSDLAEIKGDIYCFQEFYTSEEKGDFNNTDTLRKLLHLPYNHIEYTTTLRKLDHWGIATFSKYPIVNRGKIEFQTKNNNLCIFSDIVINNDTVRVYNLHLQSISFSKKDNDYLSQLKDGKDPDEDLEKSKNILRRLKRAFVKRAKQADAIRLHISTCRYPVFVCGDFNDTPASYTYQQFKEILNDAFIEKGTGLGKTYAGPWPQFRIDYIFYTPSVSCFKYQRADNTNTDHYPIWADFYHP